MTDLIIYLFFHYCGSCIVDKPKDCKYKYRRQTNNSRGAFNLLNANCGYGFVTCISALVWHRYKEGLDQVYLDGGVFISSVAVLYKAY